ncbi:hypothetical protein [Longibacter sp.]|uniref:hypothetical protein n=1 Tax=Longibacter sp. TaxID=2045415 RepID=UPI003EB72A9C
MTSQPVSATSRPPKHLWIVGGLSLVWNAFGAFDYAMTQFQVEAYMSNFTAEQLDYFYGFPAWANAVWALGVWGAVAGSVGLLLKKAWAEWAFGISIVGLVGTSIYTMVLTDGTAIMGGPSVMIFSIVLWLITIGLYVYSRAMARKGVLT